MTYRGVAGTENTAISLLYELADLGITASWDSSNEQLILKGRIQELTSEMRELLAREKPQLALHLTRQESPIQANQSHRLWEALRARGRVRINSEVLGEVVYFARDDVLLMTDEQGLCDGCVVYRTHELELVRDVSPSHLKLIHMVKKIFGGELIP